MANPTEPSREAVGGKFLRWTMVHGLSLQLFPTQFVLYPKQLHLPSPPWTIPLSQGASEDVLRVWSHVTPSRWPQSER